MVKVVEAALVIAILATRVQVSEPKRLSVLRHNAKRTGISQLGVFPSSSRCEIDALEDEGWILNYCEDSAMDEQEFYVYDGGICTVFSQDLVASEPSLQKITCQQGRWTISVEGSALDRPHSRQKRGWWRGRRSRRRCYGIWWWRWCRPVPRRVVKKAPTYPTNCTPSALKSVYYTPPGQEAMTITWIDPKASDSNLKSNQQTSGTRKGELFAGLTKPGGMTHTIIYEARDYDEQRACCTFSFAVQVRKCGPLLWPLYGRRSCSHDETILGSTCSYDCIEGYTLANNISETTCSGEDDPQWSAEPFCEKITCSTPPDVDDGAWTCDQGYEYDDYCVIECSDGYTLQGQVFTHCMASGTWFWLRPTTCIDDIAPELRCNTPQIFYTEWASTSASVVWELPSVTDNSGDNLTAVQTGGPDPGVSISAGDSVYATYVATDASNNQASPCEVEIRVEATNCGHPLDILEDARLRFICTTDPKYIYGDTCALECDRSLPLEGTDLLTCERNDTGVRAPVGYWDWGNGSMPACSDIACAPMKAPKNGALVSDWINGRPANTMQCNQEFTIPELIGFNGIFLCQDSGSWSPYYEKAPDCSERYSSRAFLLPSTFFYYEGTCGVDDTISENFEGIVSEMNTIFAALCPTETVCETKNPRITCGETRKKRNTGSMHSVRQRSTSGSEHTEDSPRIRVKRQTGPYLEFTFEIAVSLDTSQIPTDEIWPHVDDIHLRLLKPAVQAAVDDGTFDISGWAPLYHFETSEYGYASCDPGSVQRGTTCIKCPPGHFPSDSECVKCARGEYCEAGGCQLCTACPAGYFTRDEASESLDNCTQLCEPGTYSPDTFVPCAKCQAGLYQPDTGQTHCLPCPMGMSTKSMGSMTQADCQAYDVIVTDTGGYALVFDIPMMTNLAFEFFVKILSGTPEVHVSVNGELDVSIAGKISVSTASTADDIGYPSDDTWIHVAIFWGVTNGDLTAFYRGTLVVSHSSVFPTVTPLGGNLYVSASGGSVAISGLRLRDSLLEEAGNMTATSCHNLDASDVINMEHLKYADGIILLVPSLCDAIDECSSSPCGQHSRKCKQIVDGFICTCKGGWTGVTCDTPPDYCPGNDCQNGATCVSGLTNYTCQCHSGFSGVSCQTVPVDGGWSVWTRWTECSLTCNTGSHERTRSCDSPIPDPHGQDCVGVDIEMEDCNVSPCRVCANIESGSGAVPECEVDPDTGSLVCTGVCITDAYVQPPGLGNETHTCGLETAYKWQPKKKLPGCTKAVSPRVFTASTTATIVPTVPAEAEQGVVNGIASNMASTTCAQADVCNIDVQLDNAESSRRRRNTGTTVTITYTVAINDTSDLQLDQYVQNGTVSPGLQEIINAVESLEATTVAINNSASTYFDVTTNGVTYTVDTNTVTFDGGANCSEGQVVTDGLCAECPAGSYQVGDYCSLCDKGTYQDQTGQAECVLCSYGFTTETVGSDASTDCSVLETTAAPSTSSTTTSQPGDDESGKGVLLIVIIVVSVLVALIIGVIVVIVCIKKQKAGSSKIAVSTSNLHDSTQDFHSSARADLHGMLQVRNVPPMSAFIGKQAPVQSRPSTAVTVRDLDLDVDPFNEDAYDNNTYYQGSN